MFLNSAETYNTVEVTERSHSVHRFYRAMLCISAVYAGTRCPSVCLSVCLSVRLSRS